MDSGVWLVLEDDRMTFLQLRDECGDEGRSCDQEDRECFRQQDRCEEDAPGDQAPVPHGPRQCNRGKKNWSN